jgi:hypothetical protein
MRFCSNCKKLTAGSPPYCNFCGYSYGVRLCPRGHKNPRVAQACSECGSTELSTAAPKGGSMNGFTTIAKVIGIAILLALCLYLVYAAFMFVTKPEMTVRVMRLGFEIGALFLLWMVTIGRIRKK